MTTANVFDEGFKQYQAGLEAARKQQDDACDKARVLQNELLGLLATLSVSPLLTQPHLTTDQLDALQHVIKTLTNACDRMRPVKVPG